MPAMQAYGGGFGNSYRSGAYQGEEALPGQAGPATGAETVGSTRGGMDLTGMEGTPVRLRNGITYGAVQAGDIANNPTLVLDATLRGRGQYGPGAATYYGTHFQELPNLMYVNAGLDAQFMTEYLRLLDQASMASTPEEQAGYLAQAEALRENGGLSLQSQFDMGDDWLSMLQGGGLDTNAYLTELFSQSGDPNSAINILLSQGDPKDKVSTAIDMIMTSLATGNPMMARLFEAVLQWMGRQWQTDPNADQTGSFVDFLLGRPPATIQTPVGQMVPTRNPGMTDRGADGNYGRPTSASATAAPNPSTPAPITTPVPTNTPTPTGGRTIFPRG